MAEYLNRGDLIRLFEAKADMATGTPKAVYHSVCKMIALLPADDVEEVRRGKWDIEWRDSDLTYFYVCSECGEDAPFNAGTYYDQKTSKFCYNCGARMDGKGEGE